jgi:uncharacterized membrane protein YagU involved in acid resistance
VEEAFVNARRAAVAGFIATAVVTTLWLVEPFLGLPRLAVGSMLSSPLATVTAYVQISPAVGWTIHVVVGIALAMIYAAWLVDRLPGSPLIRGVLYGCAVFVVAQLTFMPLVGAGVFSRGEVPLLFGSLIGHVVYGGLVGFIYGRRAALSAPNAG